MSLLVLHTLETVNPGRVKCEYPLGIRNRQGCEIGRNNGARLPRIRLGWGPLWEVSIHPRAGLYVSTHTS